MKYADHTIYLDISDLLVNARFQSRVAGIQRVTLRLIAQLLARRPQSRIALIGLHPELKRLVEVDSGWCNEHLDHDHLQFIRAVSISAALSERSVSPLRPRDEDTDVLGGAE
jgi:hypothetical protein